jgi:hypothetical protein
VAPGDAGDVGQLVGEDRLLVELAVAVRVFEDEDAVAAFLARLQPLGVGEALDDPEPTAVVEREAHGLDDVGLAREKRDLEAFGHGHLSGRLVGLEGGGLGQEEGEQQVHHPYSTPEEIRREESVAAVYRYS